VPLDSVGRYLYVHDGGAVWHPGWKPVKATLDHDEGRHGLGYSRITGPATAWWWSSCCSCHPAGTTYRPELVDAVLG
jgi:hypothetical protein